MGGVRKSGKTTRIIDRAIQTLFETGLICFLSSEEVKELPNNLYGVRGKNLNIDQCIFDHTELTKMTHYIFDRVYKRLITEHHNLNITVEKNKQIKINEFNV